MIWFKHYVETMSDPVFCEAESEHGIAATGVYWRCLEILARTDSFTEALVMPNKAFRSMFAGMRAKKLHDILHYFYTKDYLNYYRSDRDTTLFCQKLVDISGAYRKSLQHRSRNRSRGTEAGQKEPAHEDTLLMEQRMEHKEY